MSPQHVEGVFLDLSLGPRKQQEAPAQKSFIIAFGGADSWKDSTHGVFFVLTCSVHSPALRAAPHSGLFSALYVRASGLYLRGPSKDPGLLRENTEWASTQESSYTQGTDQTQDGWTYDRQGVDAWSFIPSFAEGKCILSETISVA